MSRRNKGAPIRGWINIDRIWVKGLTEPFILGLKPSMKKWKISLASLKIHLEKIRQMTKQKFDSIEQIRDPAKDDSSNESDSFQIDSFPYDLESDDIIGRPTWKD
jgi:hypothetical protein